MMNEKKYFSDFAKETIFDGDKIHINDVINMEINIIAYRVADSKYTDRKCLTLQIEFENNKHIIFTGSTVLIDQLEKYKEQLPFITTIRKIKKYYTLS